MPLLPTLQVQCGPLVRSTFCPTKIDHTSKRADLISVVVKKEKRRFKEACEDGSGQGRGFDSKGLKLAMMGVMFWYLEESEAMFRAMIDRFFK